MSAINCPIAHSNLRFNYVAAIGNNLKEVLQELKLINSPSTS